MGTTREEIRISLGIDSKGVDTGLSGVRAKLAQFGAQTKDIFDSIKGKVAAAFSVGALASAAKAIKEFSAHIQDVAETTSVSTDFIQGFSAKVASAGGSAYVAEQGLEKLNTTIGQAREGNLNAIESFNKYKIALSDTNGRAKTTEEIVKTIADVLQGTSDAARRAAIAADLFGERAGPKLVQALRGGRKELENFITELDKLSPDDIKSMDDLSDGIDELERRVKVQGGTILGFFAGLSKHVAGSTALKSLPGISAFFQAQDFVKLSQMAGQLSVRGDVTSHPSPPAVEGVNKIKNIKEVTRLSKQLAEEVKKTEMSALANEDKHYGLILRKLMLQREVESLEKETPERLEKEIALEKIKQEILNRQNQKHDEIKQKIKQSNYDSQELIIKQQRILNSMSDITFDKAKQLTDDQRGEFRLNNPKLSNTQMDAVDRLRVLEKNAEQARIDLAAKNDPQVRKLLNDSLQDPRLFDRTSDPMGRLDKINAQRKAITEALGFLPDSERTPLADVQREMAKNAEKMDEIVRTAKQEGFNVRIVDIVQ